MRPVLLLLLLQAPGLPQDPEKLVELLRSESIVVRDDAAGALVALGRAALPALEKAARDPDREVAARAKELIRWIGISEQLTPALKKLRPKLVNRLARGDDHTWTEVFLEVAFSGISRKDLNALAGRAVRGARGADEKKNLFVILKGRYLTNTAPEFLRLLSDPHAEVVRRALEHLEDLQYREAIPRVRALLRSNVGTIRSRAAATLGVLGAREAVPDLIPLLGDTHHQARGNAAAALGQLGNREALPTLRRLLRDPHADVRGAAADALGLLDDAPSAPEIRRMLTLTDQWVVWHAARAAGRLRDREAVPVLLDLLDHASPNVKIASAAALAEVGEKSHIPRLLPLLEDGFACTTAASTLCVLGSFRGVPVLLEEEEEFGYLNALRNPDEWRKLRSATLAEDLFGTREAVITRIAERLGKTVEFPDEDYYLDVKIRIGARGIRRTLHEALSESIPTFASWILETEKIRVVPEEEARVFWSKWWKSRRKQ